MAKFNTDTIPDQALNYIDSNMSQLVLCAGQPTNYTDATTDSGSGGNALGEIAIDATDGTLAAGDTSGRKLTIAAQSGITADVGGTCDHIAIVDDTNTELLLVTTLSANETLTQGNTYDTNAFDYEIADVS